MLRFIKVGGIDSSIHESTTSTNINQISITNRSIFNLKRVFKNIYRSFSEPETIIQFDDSSLTQLLKPS